MKPILISITSRSRSSLVSKIFIEHGVWWGNTIASQNWKENGRDRHYVSYENQNIKRLLKKYKDSHWKTIYKQPVFAVPGFTRDLKCLIPPGQIWQMKTGVEYYPAFQPLDPFNVFVKRDPEAIAASLKRKRPDTNYSEALNHILWRFDYMDRLIDEHGGVIVNTDDIAQGKYDGIRAAVEYCGLVWDEGSIERSVDRKI